jgi:hypothetical protein
MIHALWVASALFLIVIGLCALLGGQLPKFVSMKRGRVKRK